MTEERCPHISAIVTFHGEGLLAHKTLLGLERVRRFTEAQGIIVELVAVLDSADSETTDIVTRCPVLRATDQVLEVNNRDPGVSRNSGVFVARGHCIAIFDGDDFYTKNWLLGALAVVNGKQGDVVVHPECLITFGTNQWFSGVWDMDDRRDHSLSSCLAINMWVAASFGKKDLYLRHPYHRTDFLKTGFGYEDWHWNLELVAHGIRHVTAKRTALLYRTKEVSTFTSHAAAGVIIRQSEFFNHPERWDKPTGAPQQAISTMYLYNKAYVEELIARRDWLESELKTVQGELERKQARLECAEAQLRIPSVQLERIRSVFPVESLIKSGALSND
jgi:glycosyltransferase involved in cell wall biosynthesis